MHTQRRLITLLLTTAMTCFVATARAVDVSGFAPSRSVDYKTVKKGPLKLHIFEPADHTKDDKRPAIVFFYGSGWVAGSPSQFYPHCEYLASRGIVAISADYRTARPHGTPPSACVTDGKSAMRYLRAHAGELGIDPDRIAAGGGSAGGQVAAAAAVVTAFDEEGEDTSVSPLPNALVLYNPVYDNGPGEYGHDRVKDYWQQFSPAHNIRKGMPPTITFLGSRDALIPVATAQRFKAAMEKVGSRSDLHIYEGQGHGFFNYKVDGGKWFIDTMQKTDAFLTSIGWLKGDNNVAEWFEQTSKRNAK